MRLYEACKKAPIRDEAAEVHKNGDYYFQNFCFGTYIGNHILRLCSHIAAKLNFRPYIRRYISQNENFVYSYPLIYPKHSEINTLCDTNTTKIMFFFLLVLDVFFLSVDFFINIIYVSNSRSCLTFCQKITRHQIIPKEYKSCTIS